MKKKEGLLQAYATHLRRDSLEMTTHAKSGHPTSCLSCAEIMSVLFFEHMQYDSKNPHNVDNDQFVLSKGHAAPILYAALKRAGAIKHSLFSLREFKSPLEGHPIPTVFPWAKVATGSLGQGFSNAVGMALSAKQTQRDLKVYVLMGDSELAEGSVYEAAQLAAHYQLENIVVIVDVNRLGQTGPTQLGHHVSEYKRRFESFGCHALVIDGHSVTQIQKALTQKPHKKPLVILAKTFKGKGVSFLEDKEGWHGRALTANELSHALDELEEVVVPPVKIQKPKKSQFKQQKITAKIKPTYPFAHEVATRNAYGDALAQLKKEPVIVFDAETQNSTFAQSFEIVAPEKFVQSYIAEQNMVGMAIGAATMGLVPFSSTFAAFFTRAHDQLRMGALSGAKAIFCGSHAGVSIGEDGPSQMGLEDISMFRNLPNSQVYYPSDAVSTQRVVELAAKHEGISYIRTSRPKTPVIYKKTDVFKPGGFHILEKHSHAKAIIVGCGVTVFEALHAHDKLLKQGIPVCVIDCYSIKPFDAQAFIRFAKTHGNRVIVVEDHFPAGGLGEMIAKEIADAHIHFEHLCVHEPSMSGSKDQLLSYHHIDENAIMQAVRKGLRK
ncbi:MAG: transketolase [Candidatus Woesearchaeota archaeon]